MVVLIIVLIMTSCSSGADEISPLEPIPGTSPGYVEQTGYSENDVAEVVTNSSLVNDYVSDVEVGYGLIDESSPAITDFLVRRGFAFCVEFRDGMTLDDFEKSIQEAATDLSDVVFDRAIGIAAAINFCPDQLYKFES